MHKNVEILLGRLATDPVLRRRFIESPLAVLSEAVALGLELTSVEIDALMATESAALTSFARSLDRRLRRATPTPNQNKEPL